MKKRFLSAFLALVLMVAILPVSANAATETVDGVKYTVVSTAKELYNALTAGGNILLKNNIVLDSSFDREVTIKQSTVLNGNGYSLTYTKTRTAPLFNFAAGTTISMGKSGFQNIGFGTKEVPMVLSQGNSLFTEQTANTCLITYQNVDFYVTGTALTGNRVGALYRNLTGGASFFGCNLHVEMKSITSGNTVGGWIGEVSTGDLVMTECMTSGSISGDASYMGAVVGKLTEGNYRITNCINLADVTGEQQVAGFLGNVGNEALTAYHTGCVNYGRITSTGSGYNSVAGGILARSSNIRDLGNKRLRVFYDCVNYGTVTSGGYSGGILGSGHDSDTSGPTSKYLYFTFKNCVNYGTVSGADYAGGMMGIASPVTHCAELTNCINVGKISSKNGYAGNFAGMLSSGVIEGGLAAGVIRTKLGTDVLTPHNTGTYTLKTGDYANQAWEIVTPTVANVNYIGEAKELAEGITKIAPEALSDVLKKMSSLGDISFVSADAADQSAYVVAAAPILRGFQQSVQVKNGKADLRFVAAIDAKEAYKTFGFRMTVHSNGQTVETNQTTADVYTAVHATSANGTDSLITAASQASNYLFAAVIKDLSLADGAVIEVTPYALTEDGTEYVGDTRVISCKNGTYQIEPMMINNVLISEYAIVYDHSNQKCEQLLAKRLSDEIAKLTGAVLPVFSDSKTCPRDAKILIGDTKVTTVTGSARTLCTQANPNEIAIMGEDTACLSEAITYFLDTLEEQMLAGERTWNFEELTVPVDTSISMMAYNLGAKDNSYIKKAEWELIVDYLPDLITFQEPWAAYLDDFLNTYAVQPNPGFKSGSSIDVMETDVDNKSFTGRGYYGVYWGLPRWRPEDKNQNGRASYSVILYAKDRFTVDESRSGTFWLSAAPDISGSKFAASSHVRCATYATLTDRNTGKTFILVNTHLGGDETTKTDQAKVLLQELKARVGTDLPIFITGDMNAEAQTKTIAYYKKNSVMSMTAMDEAADYTYRHRRNIDWLFMNCPDQVDVTYYNYCGERPFLNNIWNKTLVMGRPSDHPAVYTEFTFR